MQTGSSHQHVTQKVKNQQALYQIIAVVRYLCRQGMSLRDDGNELDCNLCQLLYIKSDVAPNQYGSSTKKMSIQVQKYKKIMGLDILWDLTKELFRILLSLQYWQMKRQIYPIKNKWPLYFDMSLITYWCIKNF